MSGNYLNFWTFDGVKFSSFGAVTLLDDYLDMPTRRGDNIEIPMRDGRHWTKKYFDQRTLMFGIEVQGTDVPNLERQLDNARALFGVRSLRLLSNVWVDGSERHAFAEVPGSLGISRDPDPRVARIAVTFVLPDPFFRSPIQLSSAQVINASPFTFTLVNPGSAEERKAVLRLDGPLSSPTITNLVNNVSFTYTGVIAGGHYVELNCDEMTAVTDLGVNVVGNVSHVGDVVFMAYVSGNNLMRVTDGTHTTGIFTTLWYPPYF